MTLSHEKCVLLVNTKKSVYPAITIRKVTKKRRSATAIRHQGSPQAHLLKWDNSTPMRSLPNKAGSICSCSFRGGDSDDD